MKMYGEKTQKFTFKSIRIQEKKKEKKKKEELEEEKDEPKDIKENSIDEYFLAEKETPKTSRKGPGRTRLEKTGKTGRPKKIFNEVPVKRNTEAENPTGEDESRNHEEHFAKLVEHSDPQTAVEALSSPEPKNGERR